MKKILREFSLSILHLTATAQIQKFHLAHEQVLEIGVLNYIRSKIR